MLRLTEVARASHLVDTLGKPLEFGALPLAGDDSIPMRQVRGQPEWMVENDSKLLEVLRSPLHSFLLVEAESQAVIALQCNLVRFERRFGPDGSNFPGLQSFRAHERKGNAAAHPLDWL